MTTWTQLLAGTEDQDITKYLQTTSGIIYGFIGLVQTIKFLRWDKHQKIKSFVLLDISSYCQLLTLSFLSITDASYILGPLQLAMKSMIKDLILILVMLIVVIFAFSLAIYVTFQQLPVLYGPGADIPVGFGDLGSTLRLFELRLFILTLEIPHWF